MDRLQAFEAMLNDIQEQCGRGKKAMNALKAQGNEKTATCRQYMGNRLMQSRIPDLNKQYVFQSRDYGGAAICGNVQNAVGVSNVKDKIITAARSKQ